MTLTPLNFNSNGKPEPTEDNTITLREYTGGPIAQFDAEQNFINFKGRVNDLLNSVSNLTSTVSSNQSSLQTEISNLSTTLTNSINSSNAAQDATIASNLATLNTAIANQESSTAAQLASLDNSVSAHVSPVGSIMAFAGTTTPAYWLVCDGRSLVKSTYQALFDAIGYTYGGSGANFNVPNLLGRVIAGTGTTGRFSGWGMGSTGGVENIALTASQIPPHGHIVVCSNDDSSDNGRGSGYTVHKSNISFS